MKQGKCHEGQRRAERGKNHKHLDSCLQKRRHFPPFDVSVNGMLITEVGGTLKLLVGHLSTKWRKPYYRTCRYVQSTVAVTMVISNHRCIRVYRVTASQIIVERPQWEDGARHHLYQ